MKFGIFTSLGNTTWERLLALWRHAEKSGWDAACVTDHFMPNTPDRVGDMLEGWTTLSALATAVPRMRVGTIVLGNTYRHPAVLAKMAATLDVVTGGRLLVGLGGAWQQNEHEAYGIPFYTVPERLARLDEACQVLKALWTEPRASFSGRYYQLTDAPLMPKPVQKPYPELMIGGGGEKVTMRLAAKHADHWNCWGGPETHARKRKILDDHCAALGRDPKTLLRSANMPVVISDDAAEVRRVVEGLGKRMGWQEEFTRDLVLGGSVAEVRDKLGRLRDAGVDMLFVPSFVPANLERHLDGFMADVAPAFR
ncbi:MAG: TIGR03560 family F420-dependent LLM class oxidoreductase [Candidatus Rokubacteria bacterium]|nr:TIGR03560 family F420-dependent LLM class oxidoreductase [Candidatus Rokubacteria bacterium]